MNFLKQSGDLALLVNVEVGKEKLNCDYLYCHHNCPERVQVTGEKGQFMLNLKPFLKRTPTDYIGNIEVELV